MDYQLSSTLSKALLYSKEEAFRLHNGAVGPGHLLLGLLKGNEGKALEVIHHFPLPPGRLKATVEGLLAEQTDNMAAAATPETIIINTDASRILKLSFLEARLFKSHVIDTEHLLLAMLHDEDNIARRSLNANSINYENACALLNLKPDVQSGFGVYVEPVADALLDGAFGRFAAGTYFKESSGVRHVSALLPSPARTPVPRRRAR